jgi:hypothetical protein
LWPFPWTSIQPTRYPFLFDLILLVPATISGDDVSGDDREMITRIISRKGEKRDHAYVLKKYTHGLFSTVYTHPNVYNV